MSAQVRDMHLLQSVPTDGTARPTLHPYRYPLVGDDACAARASVRRGCRAGTVTPLDTEPLAT